MQSASKYVRYSGAVKRRAALALWPLCGAVVIGGVACGAARAQSIRLKNAPRVAQLPKMGETITAAELVAAAPAPIAPEALPAPAASREVEAGPALISLQFENIEIAKLISMIADQGGVGIIVPDEVNKRVKSVNLKDVTAEKAIKYIAESNGYSWRKLDEKTFAIARYDSSLAPLDGPIAVINPRPTNTIQVPAFRPEPVPAPSTELPELFQPRREEAPKTYAYLTLRNVTPRMIAWWVDPAHNPVPAQFQPSQNAFQRSLNRKKFKYAVSPADTAAIRGNGALPFAPAANNIWAPAGSVITEGNSRTRVSTSYSQFPDIYTQANPQIFRGGGAGQQFGGQGAAGGGGGGTLFSLPTGVESLVAIDPQNALLVVGTPEGIQQLEQIIGFLDRPLRQVEIEAQFVTVGTTDLAQFGIDFTSSNGPFRLNTTGRAPAASPGSISVGFVRNNFRATLTALESRGRSKTVSAPRVTAINNLTATIESNTETPFLLTSVTSNLNGTNNDSQDLLTLTTTVGLTVTPTINNDDTITVVMSPTVEATAPPTIAGIPGTTTSNTIDTIANLKDGDTIALGGLRTKANSTTKTGVPILRNIPLLGKLFESNNKSEIETELIIFVTARIIRRIDDPVPGT